MGLILMEETGRVIKIDNDLIILDMTGTANCGECGTCDTTTPGVKRLEILAKIDANVKEGDFVRVEMSEGAAPKLYFMVLSTIVIFMVILLAVINAAKFGPILALLAVLLGAVFMYFLVKKLGKIKSEFRPRVSVLNK